MSVPGAVTVGPPVGAAIDGAWPPVGFTGADVLGSCRPPSCGAGAMDGACDESAEPLVVGAGVVPWQPASVKPAAAIKTRLLMLFSPDMSAHRRNSVGTVR